MTLDDGIPARMAGALVRVLLRLYPREFREEVGLPLLGDIRHRTAELHRRRGAIVALLWLPRLAVSLLVTALGSWRDELARAHVRETTHSESIMESLLQDVRFALRGLRRNPGFTGVALLTLALGIGANTAVFSVVNGVVLRPLPYPDSDELALLYQSSARRGEMFGRVSYEDLRDWQSRVRSLESIAGFAPVPRILIGEGDPLEVEMTYVTPGFFEVLGVRAELGRPLQTDDQWLAQRNAVISRTLWRTRFGEDPNMVGRRLVLSGDPYTIVGVMPEHLTHPTPETDVWVPQSLVEPNMFSNGPPSRGDRYLQAIGRLAPSADAVRAQRELTAVSDELAAIYPDSNVDWATATVVPLHESIVGDVDHALMIVLTVVGVILLIACANLANLLLLVGAGLMGRSFLSLRSVDPGFQPEGVLTATMQLNHTGVPDEGMATFLVQRREEILRNVRELPGVESAGRPWASRCSGESTCRPFGRAGSPSRFS